VFAGEIHRDQWCCFSSIVGLLFVQMMGTIGGAAHLPENRNR
jgi:hypothetical protein